MLAKYIVAAIIYYDNTVLWVHRPKHKFDYISQKYEFPGGKIEPGEQAKDAIIREIEEELKIYIIEPIKGLILGFDNINGIILLYATLVLLFKL